MTDEIEQIPSDKGGAPTDYTPAVVNKLAAAFNNGFNVREACQYAGISHQTYYNWVKLHPEFFDTMQEAQDAPNKKAKEVLVEAMKAKDKSAAMYWLDRRDPDFKAKGQLEVSPGQQDTEEKLKEFLDDTADGAYDEASGEPATPTEAVGGSEVAQSPQDIS